MFGCARASHLLEGHRARHTADVCQPVLSVVPAPVRQVDPAHEGHRLVDDDDLLVMRPQVDGGGDVIRVTHHLQRGNSQAFRQETRLYIRSDGWTRRCALTLMLGCRCSSVLLLYPELMPSANSTSLYSITKIRTPCSCRKQHRHRQSVRVVRDQKR